MVTGENNCDFEGIKTMDKNGFILSKQLIDYIKFNSKLMMSYDMGEQTFETFLGDYDVSTGLKKSLYKHYNKETKRISLSKSESYIKSSKNLKLKRSLTLGVKCQPLFTENCNKIKSALKTEEN